MSQRSPSTLDEETAIAVALSISEEEAKQQKSPTSEERGEPVSGSPPTGVVSE